MRFDRYYVKTLSKTILHEARPRPWLVALVYRLLTFVLPFGLLFFLPLLLVLSLQTLSPLHGQGGSFWFLLPSLLRSAILLLTPLLMATLAFLLYAGYFSYCLRLWREKQGSLRDLFRGFSSVPRLLALLGLLFLFSLLWLLPTLPLLALVPLLTSRLRSPGLLTFLTFLLQLGLGAYFLNRTLRYALALPLLLDHPEYTPRQTLAESKRLMTGKRWSLYLLHLSFLGWRIAAFLLGYFGGAFLSLPLWALLLSCYSPGQSSALAPAAFLLPFLLMLATMLLVSAPLALWVNGYAGVSFAGFYDCAAGRPQTSSTPPWQPQPSETLPPPEPWTTPGGK